LKLMLAEPEVFRKLFECISRFADRAHFEVSDDGLRIRSIDENDFCYVDLLLRRPFFKDFPNGFKASFGIDISRFSSLLSRIAPSQALTLNVNEDYVELEATHNWDMLFRVQFLEQDPYDLPEPRNFAYEAFVNVGSKEFSAIVNTASTISKELELTIDKNRFVVSTHHGDYSFTGESRGIAQVRDSKKQRISAFTLANYINVLAGLIRKCEKVGIWLGDDKPVKLELLYEDKGVFDFFISHMKRGNLPRKISDRGGKSLPRLTISKLPEFLLYLTNCPQGEETRFLREAGLETSGGDYSRMAQKLGFIENLRGKVKLVKNGEVFVNLMQNDPGQAKSFLHSVAISKIDSYRAMVTIIKRKALSPEELYEELNLKSEQEHLVDKQDITTLLGLAIWCGIVDRKLALYYLAKED
jgi:hypothetical protein